MSRFKEYLEGNNNTTITFNIGDLEKAIIELKNMTIKKAIKIAEQSGYLDIKWETLKFADELSFTNKRLSAMYNSTFLEGGEDLYEGLVFITWDGKKYELDFGGSAKPVSNDKK